MFKLNFCLDTKDSSLFQWLSKAKRRSVWDFQRRYSDQHAHCGITEPGGYDGKFICKSRENYFFPSYIIASKTYFAILGSNADKTIKIIAGDFLLLFSVVNFFFFPLQQMVIENAREKILNDRSLQEKLAENINKILAR